MFLGYAFQTAGLQYTTPSKSGFVTGSSVVLVPLLLAMFWASGWARGAYAGAMCRFGLYFLTIPAEGIAYLNRGDVLTFVAAGLYAVHIILVGEYTKQHSATALSLVQVAACAVMAWVIAGVAAAIRWQPARFECAGSCIGNLDLRCVCDGRGVLHSIVAQRYTTPSHAAILFTLEPSSRDHLYILIRERLGDARCSGRPSCLPES